MKKRPRKVLDGVDRNILRLLYAARRPLTGNQIAQKIHYSSPAVKRRLVALQSRSIIKPLRRGKVRIFDRSFIIKGRKIIKKVRAPSRILWGLDIQKEEKKKVEHFAK